ncbi:MAG: bifunctional phosphopantothenoylcysteine decarboxylase/phosphopantothenate--cysteine ligase CoaBC [Bacteroidota bacterium]|nr:bifunctional phosphopantothenoylcysteine decarboxylase/phosphopantothenate--cysteine ligase CoaBC [Bacteroidota bacterium]
MLKGKKFILGITGSIAAYKAAYLTRLLKKEGAEVKVILTSYGKEFITPVTLATLSNNTVLSDFFSHDDGAWNSHVDLGIWADAMIIAPATANTIAKMANGVADNLLLTTYLSARCPVVVAPAMDLDMFQHPATRANLKMLESYGNHVIEPASGELASGLEGKGRMEEPEEIVIWLNSFFKKKSRFEEKRVLITAGPTFEKIDPVRFIGNYSSGKMGIAVTEAFLKEGAEVNLVLGPVSEQMTEKLSDWVTGGAGRLSQLKITKVKSAVEMYDATANLFSASDIVVFTAAVADFRPEYPTDQKIKDARGGFSLNLIPNPDIAYDLGKQKRSGQFTIGFALETDDGIQAAIEKKANKNFDLIVLNSLQDHGAGFGGDTNRISIIGKDNKPQKFELKTKAEVAKDILMEIF